MNRGKRSSATVFCGANSAAQNGFDFERTLGPSVADMGDAVTTYSISQVAEIASVSVHTLRYYERAGLMIAPLERSQSAHRVYAERDLRWVTFVTKLRSTGMGISQIRQYVELARQGESTNEARLQLLVEHREKVVAQLRETQSSLDAISYKIAEYSRKVSNI